MPNKLNRWLFDMNTILHERNHWILSSFCVISLLIRRNKVVKKEGSVFVFFFFFSFFEEGSIIVRWNIYLNDKYYYITCPPTFGLRNNSVLLIPIPLCLMNFTDIPSRSKFNFCLNFSPFFHYFLKCLHVINLNERKC